MSRRGDNWGMSLDPLFKRLFGDEEPTRVGSGWLSGVLSVLFGFASLGGVLCFHFPQFLTAPQFRTQYPVELLRGVLQALLLLAFTLGAVSSLLRRRKVLAVTGVMLATAASLLGGASVPLPAEVSTRVGLGLDWFLINLCVLVLIFVPLERAFPLHPEQPVFRAGWTTDGLYFLASHLAVQLFAFASVIPVTTLAIRAFPGGGPVARWDLPWVVEVLLIIALADLTQYWVHRGFHRFGWGWRLHSVHHTSSVMDWLAGSRLNLLDALITRSLSIAPVLLMGFSPMAVTAYLIFVSFHAVFIHCNVGFNLRWLEPFLVTPRIHHFHHAQEVSAVDKNFAVHLPLWDRLFGTRFLPDARWPASYGLLQVAPDPKPPAPSN